MKEPCVGSQTSVSGVNVTVAESALGAPGMQAWSLMGLREPLVTLAVAKVSSQVRRSEPVRVTTTGVSSLVVTILSSAVGTSLAQVMITITVAGVDVNMSSSTV